MGEEHGATERRSFQRPRTAPRHPTLRVVHSPDANALSRAFPLDGAGYQFGRGSEGTAVLDNRLSRNHFRVQPGKAGYLLEDLESTNGTYLDGRRVQGRVPLDGTVIAAGDTLFVVDSAPRQDRLPALSEVDASAVEGLVGSSSTMEALRASVATVAPEKGGVLLLGPTGCGKEVTAHAIHRASGRSGPFVPVNCAAIPSHLAESELFGHEKGAFTGADRARPGAFRASSGGTLFLDEVGDLPSELQPKLLRALQDSTVQPVGGSAAVKVDLRVIAATHKPLDGMDFRQDLLARLCDWVLHIPALADRKADILTLWRHFIETETSEKSWKEDPEVLEALLLHDWPLNVRDLQKLAHRLVVLSADRRFIDLDALPPELSAPILARYAGEEDTLSSSAPAPSLEELKGFLADARGNISELARRQGWHRTQVNRWLKKHNIDPSHYR